MPELGRKNTEEFKESEKIPVTVILDNVRSMHNVGSVFRTADAFLIERICLCGYTPQPPHRDIHKTALGATETVAWEYFPSAKECIENLKENGYQIFSVEQVEGSISLDQLSIENLDRPLAVVLGNEVEGVQDEVLALSDGAIEIPQFGTKHSLNVSVAAGIVLYEIGLKYRLEKDK
jgi:tRNA G18 (ribose-2'-O)-methylase SpoU